MLGFSWIPDHQIIALSSYYDGDDDGEEEEDEDDECNFWKF